ncbi:MAG: transketolase [Actinomycetota bacterium]|nr:transketolase [Actinomycetota bacterium]
MLTTSRFPVRNSAPDSPVSWADDDAQAVTYLRALAMDAVQSVGNGHPGTAMSLAPVAYLLFRDFVRHDPTDPSWLGRDRFVMSAGHSSLTLYSQLFLSGTLELDDLRTFRTWGSRTPGHPEYEHTAGVETTTGPLGQGLATAVGMAMAARYDRGMLDANCAPDAESPFDHRVWVIASDGDLEEGISAEASSLAGRQQLGNLCVIWDDNRISIEGDTSIAFTEDVVARYRAHGWNVHEVEMLPSGDVDVTRLAAALRAAQMDTSAPTFIRLRTTIAWPAPSARGTAKSHGAALGTDEVAATKRELGLNPDEHFAFDSELLARIRGQRTDAGIASRTDWESRFTAWKSENPDSAKLLTRLLTGEPPADLDQALPHFEVGTSVATRKASGDTINAFAAVMPELWGGSADLAESNNTTIAGAKSFLPEDTATSSPYGRVIHFGIREHAMGAILNGIALDGLTRPFGGTFLVFSDYMRGAVRLAALMGIPSTFVWTHDSIGLGEDGPTHQPIEHLWSLRAIPGLAVCRPADARETAAAWLATMRQRGPVGLILSRQNLPVLDIDEQTILEGVAQGGYLIRRAAAPQAILIATGSEVSLALAAAEALAADGIDINVVSMPCLEWFNAQEQAYQDSVIDPSISARVAVEAGSTLGWHRYVGDRGAVIGLDHFGASADGPRLYSEFGITTEAIADAVRGVIG